VSLFHLVILALIQGITEFLPVSSSAHLILAPLLMDWADQGPLIDVMAHLGTLVAVLVYFRADVMHMTAGALDVVRGKVTPGARLALLLIAATPPALLAGAALYVTGVVDSLRDPVLIAWMNLIFALPLWLADQFAPRRKTVEDMTMKGALIAGVAQCFALIPGVSRSGVTMTAVRGLGVTRADAARFSMLMAIPILLAFGAAAGLELAMDGAEASLTDGLIVAALSFVSALAVIALLMRLVERIGFLPFAVYRVALGLILLALFGPIPFGGA